MSDRPGPKPLGSVRQKGKRWEARVTVAGKTISRSFDTSEEAHNFLRAVRQQSREKDRRTSPTLMSWGAKVLDDREVSKLTRHIKQERSIFRAHLQPWSMAHVALRKIERRHVAELVRTVLNKPGPRGKLSRGTTSHVLRLLRTILREAADAGMIKTNPAVGVRVPRTPTRPKVKAWTFLDPAEIRALLGVTHATSHTSEWALRRSAWVTVERRAVYAAAIYTGLRKSELWHLRWERVHLDVERPYLEVRAPLKSEHALRDVPLLPPAVRALLAWRDIGARNIKGLVWPSDTGRVRRDWTAGWRDHQGRPGWKSRAEIERPVRFHDLRHTFCSHLVMGTWGRAFSLLEVKELAGHSSISVTQRYAHLAPEGVAAKMAELADTMDDEH